MSSVGDFAKKVYDTLSGMLDNLSTLTVVTSTVDPTGKATVRATTEERIDGDTQFKIPVDAQGNIDSSLLAQHQTAVGQARAARQGTWDNIIKVVQGSIEVEKAELGQK